MRHLPNKTLHRMQCSAGIGECPILKTLSQSMTHDGTFDKKKFQKLKFSALKIFFKSKKYIEKCPNENKSASTARDVVESGARTRSEVDHLYSKLVMLLVLRSGLGDPTDPDVLRQTAVVTLLPLHAKGRSRCRAHSWGRTTRHNQ